LYILTRSTSNDETNECKTENWKLNIHTVKANRIYCTYQL